MLCREERNNLHNQSSKQILSKTTDCCLQVKCGKKSKMTVLEYILT